MLIWSSRPWFLTRHDKIREYSQKPNKITRKLTDSRKQTRKLERVKMHEKRCKHYMRQRKNAKLKTTKDSKNTTNPRSSHPYTQRQLVPSEKTLDDLSLSQITYSK